MQKTIVALLAISLTPCCEGSTITSNTSVATGIVAPGYPGLQQGVGQSSGYVAWQGIQTLIGATATAQSVVSYGAISLAVSTSTENACDCGLMSSPYSVAEAHAVGGFSDTLTIYGGDGLANLLWGVMSSGQVTYSLPSQAFFGQPFQISASATADIDAVPNIVADRHAAAYFSLFGLLVNGSGNYSYVDGSDVALPITGTFVHAPEPATWILASIAALIVVVGRSRIR